MTFKKIAIVFTLMPMFAFADGKHSFTLGYANTTNDGLPNELRDDHFIYTRDGSNPQGINMKYRYEFNDRFGAIVSTTYTKSNGTIKMGATPETARVIKRHEKVDVSNKTIHFSDYKYEKISLMAGPTYRVNQYVSSYALLGIDHTRVKIDEFENSDYDKNRVSYGAGLQFNPTQKIVIDTSVEKTPKAGNFKPTTTLAVGVGYRF